MSKPVNRLQTTLLNLLILCVFGLCIGAAFSYGWHIVKGLF